MTARDYSLETDVGIMYKNGGDTDEWDSKLVVNGWVIDLDNSAFKD